MNSDMTDPPIESLSITFPFFILGMLGMSVAGILMVTMGNELFVSHWLPKTIGLVHTITLGFIGITMVGALIQVSPVVGGCRLPLWRVAYFEQIVLSTGIASLLLSLLMSPLPQAGGIGLFFLGVGFTSFSLRALVGLAKSSSPHNSRRGMFIALFSLIALVTLGVLMTKGYAGDRFPDPPGSRGLWIQLHLTFAILGWIGALIMSVSWQVLPMFYLTPDPPKDLGRLSISLVMLGVSAPMGFFMVGIKSGNLDGSLMAWAALPAVIAVWGIEPIQSLLLIRERRRKRPDASLLGWIFGLSTGIFTLFAVVITLIWPTETLKQLVGWLALWGWASMIIHAMLHRIIPFLVWYSRFSPLVGMKKGVKIPSMRKLLPDQISRRGILLHFGTTVFGAGAILLASDQLFRMTGILILFVAGNLMFSIFKVLTTSVPRIN